MLTYKQFLYLSLTEGIIKVDKPLLNFMEAAFVVNFLSFVNTKLKDKITTPSKYQDVYDDYITQHSIKKLGNTYLGLTYDHNNIYNKFNFGVGTKSLDEQNAGSFHRGSNGSLDSINICFEKQFLDKFNEYLRNPSEDKLNLLFEEKKTQIEHELAHMVEWCLRVKRFKHKGIKKNYDTDEKDYYTSDIEFESMIISLVRNFSLMVKEYKVKHDKPMSVKLYKDLAKDILNGELYDEIDNVFMMHTKDITPTKYKVAVRKAYVEIIDNIDSLIEEGYLK